MPGPLPNPNRRRRNKPTIPGVVLPAAGRTDRAPECPYDLGEAGRKWWIWAWALPQATQWDDGTLYFVARRAQLEDDLALMGRDDLDLGELLGTGKGEAEKTREVKDLIGRLKRLATGQVTLMKEMREIDNRLGLNPQALAALRWTIEESEESGEVGKANVRHIRAVE